MLLSALWCRLPLRRHTHRTRQARLTHGISAFNLRYTYEFFGIYIVRFFLAMDRIVSIDDFESRAREVLPAMTWGYYASGSETESTLRENIAALQRIKLVPRALVDVSQVSMRLRLLGLDLGAPLVVAPMAMQQLAHAEGELAVLAAAQSRGLGMCLSTMSTTSLQEVAAAAAAAPAPWFQLYVLRNRDASAAMVREAERAGYGALVLTADAPRLGKREADHRNG